MKFVTILRSTQNILRRQKLLTSLAVCVVALAVIAIVVISSLLILAAWYAGAEWWTKRRIVVTKGLAREVSNVEDAMALLTIVLIVYIVHAWDRGRD